MTRTALALLFLSCLCAPALAALPVEISAAGELEWDRAAKTYTARQDVVARRGETEVRSQSMTARYGEEGDATDIIDITAADGVVISAPPYSAYGERGVYDARTGDALLTGGALRVETESTRLTAQDKIEYSAAGNTVTASGGAQVVRPGQTLTADRLTAFFSPGADGKMRTEKVTAAGSVVVRTEKETAHGESGIYNVAEQEAVLTGGVRIYQGESWLEGARAVIDLRTGVSRLFAEDGAEDGGGRVRGVFYPGKDR